MASFETEQETERLRSRYVALKNAREPLLDAARHWVDTAVALHSDCSDAAKKAEIVARRDELIDELRVIFNI